MTTVSISYILQAKEGFGINASLSNIIGIIVSITCFALFYFKMKGISTPFIIDATKKSEHKNI